MADDVIRVRATRPLVFAYRDEGCVCFVAKGTPGELCAIFSAPEDLEALFTDKTFPRVSYGNVGPDWDPLLPDALTAHRVHLQVSWSAAMCIDNTREPNGRTCAISRIVRHAGQIGVPWDAVEVSS